MYREKPGQWTVNRNAIQVLDVGTTPCYRNCKKLWFLTTQNWRKVIVDLIKLKTIDPYSLLTPSWQVHLLLNCNNCNYDWMEAFMKASTFESGIPFIFAELILHLYQYGNITFNTRMTRFLKMYSQYPHPSVMAVQPLFCHIWGV